MGESHRNAPNNERVNYQRYPPVLDMQQVFIDALRGSGLTNREIAERSGYRESYISELLNGRVRGSLESWQNMLDTINATVEVNCD